MIYKNLALSETISHPKLNGEIDLKAYEDKLRAASHLTYPLNDMLDLLHQLNEFDFGRSLLLYRRLTGYWRAYVNSYAPYLELKHPLEKWIINEAPISKATFERYKIFQKESQERLHSNMVICSIPCGMMESLLALKYDNLDNIHLIGVDSDSESINYAKQNVVKLGFHGKVSFYQRDGWNLGMTETINLIMSSGINLYEPDDQRLILLYKQFNKSLCSNGTLIISFLTPPPALSDDSPWTHYEPEALRKQKAIFYDILDIRWQVYRTEQQMKEYFDAAGLDIIKTIYDHQCMFPTIVAKKY